MFVICDNSYCEDSNAVNAVIIITVFDFVDVVVNAIITINTVIVNPSSESYYP